MTIICFPCNLFENLSGLKSSAAGRSGGLCLFIAKIFKILFWMMQLKNLAEASSILLLSLTSELGTASEKRAAASQPLSHPQLAPASPSQSQPQSLGCCFQPHSLGDSLQPSAAPAPIKRAAPCTKRGGGGDSPVSPEKKRRQPQPKLQPHVHLCSDRRYHILNLRAALHRFQIHRTTNESLLPFLGFLSSISCHVP